MKIEYLKPHSNSSTWIVIFNGEMVWEMGDNSGSMPNSACKCLGLTSEDSSLRLLVEHGQRWNGSIPSEIVDKVISALTDPIAAAAASDAKEMVLNAALEAIDFVGSANYRERQLAARQFVRAVAGGANQASLSDIWANIQNSDSHEDEYDDM